MISDTFKGARYALSGFALMNTDGIRRYVIIPLLINIILFSIGIYYAFGQANSWINSLLEFLPGWLEWLTWLAWPLIAILILIAVFYTFTLVANLVASPFNGIFSEKLEQALTGSPPPSEGRFIETLRGIQNAITSEISKFIYLLSCIIPLLLISIIPVVSTVLWFLFGAWMLSLTYMDYPMGNHGFTFKEQREIAKQKRGICLGFGMVIVVMTMIPILNFLAMPAATAGATNIWVNEFAKQLPAEKF